MSDHEDELLDVEVQQSFEDAIADLKAVVEGFESADDEITIQHGDDSATVPTPTGDVTLELEVEREGEGEYVEYEIEIELEWEQSVESDTETEDADTDLAVE